MEAPGACAHWGLFFSGYLVSSLASFPVSSWPILLILANSSDPGQFF